MWVSSDPVYMALTMGSRWTSGFASPAFLHVLISMAKIAPGERPEGVGEDSERVQGNKRFPRSLIWYLQPE